MGTCLQQEARCITIWYIEIDCDPRLFLRYLLLHEDTLFGKVGFNLYYYNTM